MKVRIDDKYSIEKEAHGYSIVSMVQVRDKKTREIKVDKSGHVIEREDKRYYGTVYQALYGYLRLSVESNFCDVSKITQSVRSAMTAIDKAETEIKDKFCIEVHHAI